MRKIVCALHDVSLPRDRWLCVLPGWQLNVNVNENACAQERRNRKNSNFARTARAVVAGCACRGWCWDSEHNL